MTPFIYKMVYASGLSEIRPLEQLIVQLSDTNLRLKAKQIVPISALFCVRTKFGTEHKASV